MIDCAFFCILLLSRLEESNTPVVNVVLVTEMPFTYGFDLVILLHLNERLRDELRDQLDCLIDGH